MFKKFLIAFFTLCTIITLSISFRNGNNGTKYRKSILDNQDFEDIKEIPLATSFITYSDFRKNILLPIVNEARPANHISIELKGKAIRIDTAEELYQFSVDASYNRSKVEAMSFPEDVISELLKQHYCLGMDIDYSIMGARQFIPIGYNFTSLDTTEHKNVFQGIFDGRGFEIKNLYVADYNLLVTTEGEGENTVDIALSPYYAMFTQNEGVIMNLGLINPTFELRDVHESITKAANLVGQNLGTVENVYVIDNRDDVLAAGIRMRTPVGSGSSNYQAAGIVFENTSIGVFKSAYYVGKNVVNGAYINNFTVQPVIFYNTGTINKLVYDNTRYLTIITIGSTQFKVTEPNTFARGENETTLKNNSSLGNNWYYFPNDRYPSLLGLKYIDGNYIIEDAIDFIAFSKMINYISTAYGNQKYNEASYLITKDINLSEVAKGAYQVSDVEFSGVLSGDASDGQNRYIANLEIINGINYENYYYAGLFSSLSGTVKNITLSNFSLVIKDSLDYYSSIFLVGSIAGKLNNGEINKVSVEVNIDLGTNPIGEFALGGLVGQASGIVREVYVKGLINCNKHDFNESYEIDPNYFIGGVIGKTGQESLFFYNALNKTVIHGVATSSPYTTKQNEVNIYTGGVIGYVQNSSSGKHNLGLLTNKGSIYINNFNGTPVTKVNQYVALVVGYSCGLNYNFDDYTGLWTNTLDDEDVNNKENLFIGSLQANTYVYAAGIVVSNHIENVVFIYLYNYVGYSVNSFHNFNYASLLYNLGSSIVLSQSENYANFTLDDSSEVIDYQGVYASSSNSYSRLEFVYNYADITYQNLTFPKEISIAGITLSENIDFINVYFSGNIFLLNTQSSYPIWIAGIAKILSSNRYMKNSMTRGKKVNGIFSETKIVVAGHDTDNNTNAHLYVGGLININKSGDMQNKENNAYPKATKGILNCVNYATITTTYDNSLYGISGYGNFFAGGIVTLNGGTIQDTANMGDIDVRNLSTAPVSFYKGDDYAGRVENYSGSVILGGVTSAVIVGESRIYDSTNSGDIYAITSNLARAGGVLGLSLYEELEAGYVSKEVIYNGYTQNDTNKGKIEESVLSNGMNYGVISCITQKLGEYSSNAGTTSEAYYLYTGSATTSTSPNPSNAVTTNRTLTGNTLGTSERIGIYASAGGVIGYGLCTMRRMVNHGNVVSTDVAGGIVGATYTGLRQTTVVNIDTAINYGLVRMAKVSYFSTMANNTYLNFESMYLYDPNDIFIKQNNLSTLNPNEYPRAKRGIGGIFGRLQRVRNTYMTSEGGKFTFIVNMDPDVDLIGRLDQVDNYTSSNRFYIFKNVTYYTTNQNDLTQAVFTGYNYFYTTGTNSYPATITTTTYQAVTKEKYHYEEVNGIIYEYRYEYHEQFTEVVKKGTLHVVNGGERIAYPNSDVLVSRTTDEANSSWVLVETNIVEEMQEDYEAVLDYTKTSISSSTANAQKHYSSNSIFSNYSVHINGANKVDKITENPYDVSPSERAKYFVYDENFPMRTRSDLTQYVYYVENELLADRFKATRPYGMYVLATSSGSAVGSTLPANVDLVKLYPLKERVSYSNNYDNYERVELESDILNEYIDLLQVKYNDKSELLKDNKIKLREIGGAKTLLLNPTIDYNNKTITFTLNYKLVKGMSSISYEIIDADLPKNAKIGMALRPNVDVDEPPELILDKPGSSFGIIKIGSFTSYSEAAREVSVFRTPKYTTTYDVYIDLETEPVVESPVIYGYRRDNNSTIYSVPGAINSSIEVIFRDPGSTLNEGTDISSYVSLWFGEEKVDSEYYILSSTLLSGTNREFTIKITLSNVLRGGNYTIKYRYFELDNDGVDREITFSKNYSTANMITTLSHYSIGNSLEISNNVINSLINFGYPLDTNITFTIETISNQPSYLNNIKHSISILDNIEIAPFARIIAVRYVSQIHKSGYITYQFEYAIQSEFEYANNLDTYTTYTHYIKEREISIVNFYKNNNKVSGNNLFATREAITTRFSFDFGIDKAYSNLIYKLKEDSASMYFEISSLISGVTVSADSYLNLDMDQTVLPGEYNFPIKFVRTFLEEGNQEIDLGKVRIEKKKGVNAHLLDIKFSETLQDTDYPEIYVSDKYGNIDQSRYNPRVYYAGIDYDGSNLDSSVEYYRINGKVSNIPLNDYTPLFLDYLPPGAKISRKLYNQEDGWTPAVDKNSDPSLIALLAADFTRYPDTLEEPGEGDPEVFITYKVISEDNSKEIYYHISVVDIVYNVTLIFNVEIDDSASELKNKTILINVQNINVLYQNAQLPIGLVPINDPKYFPIFDRILSINNSVNMFYLNVADSYKYRFGRNMSGYFSFSVILPELDSNYTYVYDIYYEYSATERYLLTDVSEYVANAKGKYYYIHGGTRNRTREFTIVIRKVEGSQNPRYGLHDSYYTWQ